MLKKIIEKAKNSWAFALAAISLPLSYVFLLPCFGNGCASCPTGGVCLFSAPLLIVLIIVAKFTSKARTVIKRFSPNSRRQQITSDVL